MLWPARGAAPLLLAALLLQLVTPGALAPSLPQPSAADWLAQGAGDRGQAADLPAAAASASEQQRRLAAADASLPRQPHPHKPLPNFAIGVPAPPAKQLGPWQQGAARERAQEMSSADFLAEDYPVLGYVALCLVARDAHADLLEWLNHHLRLGVSKVYLWDHESSPPMRDVVQARGAWGGQLGSWVLGGWARHGSGGQPNLASAPLHSLQGYIDAGLVEYNSMPSALAAAHPSGKPQLAAYDACLQARAQERERAPGSMRWPACLGRRRVHCSGPQPAAAGAQPPPTCLPLIAPPPLLPPPATSVSLAALGAAAHMDGLH